MYPMLCRVSLAHPQYQGWVKSPISCWRAASSLRWPSPYGPSLWNSGDRLRNTLQQIHSCWGLISPKFTPKAWNTKLVVLYPRCPCFCSYGNPMKPWFWAVLIFSWMETCQCMPMLSSILFFSETEWIHPFFWQLIFGTPFIPPNNVNMLVTFW